MIRFLVPFPQSGGVPVSGPLLWGGVAVLLFCVLRLMLVMFLFGRVLSLTVKFCTLKIILVNLYAPTVASKRKMFFQMAPSFFFPNTWPLVGGDFNCYDSVFDKFGGTPSLDSVFKGYKSGCRLGDAWRLKHPLEKQFTRFNADLTIARRLDSFFIPKSSYHLIISCDIFPCTYSDHDFVILNLDFRDRINRGPAVWKFNNSLLNDVLFRTEIVQLIEQSLLFRHAFKSLCDFWESLKSDIKSLSISYSRRKSRIRCREKVPIRNQLILLKRQLASGSDSVKAEILDLETALPSSFTLELEGLKIRSRVKWLEEGETPSRFLLNMGNQRREKSYVLSILISHDVEVYSLEELLTVHEQFYTLLYSEEPVDSEIHNFLFSQVTSRLLQPESASCEGRLSLEELTEALSISNKNKTPGPDGLITEFYSSFWEDF